MIEFNDASSMAFVAFGVDLQRFAFVDEIAEHLVEDVAEISVADGCDRIGSIADDVVVMSHYVEVLQPGHFSVDGLQVASICLFPVLVLIVTSVIRVGLFDVVD